MKYKANLYQEIVIISSSILVALVSALLNLYPDLNFQNPYIHGQGGNDDDLLASNSTNTNTSSISPLIVLE